MFRTPSKFRSFDSFARRSLNWQKKTKQSHLENTDPHEDEAHFKTQVEKALDRLATEMGKGSDKTDLMSLRNNLDARNLLLEKEGSRNWAIGNDEKVSLEYRIAATDYSFEKATLHLTKRAEEYQRGGILSAGIFVLLLVGAICLALNATPISDLTFIKLKDATVFVIEAGAEVEAGAPFKPAPKDPKVFIDWNEGGNWKGFAYITSKLSLGGLIAAGLYMSFSFSVSFFDESLKAYGRRNAMRWGRLYIWLNDGKMDPKIIADSFGGSYDTKTAFSRVKPEIAARGWLSNMPEIFATSRKIDDLEKSVTELMSMVEKLKPKT